MGFFSALFGKESDDSSDGKEAKIWFSREHVGKSSGRLETDTYRSVDNGPTEKIAHNECEPTQISINKG